MCHTMQFTLIVAACLMLLCPTVVAEPDANGLPTNLGYPRCEPQDMATFYISPDPVSVHESCFYPLPPTPAP